MRSVNKLTILAAASLMVSAVAQASEPGLPWQVSSSQGVAAVSAVRPPATHWNVVIGTGEAAAAEAGMVRPNDVAPAGVRSYPKPDWTAAIGRGTAAARPIS
jgi:hypothetical protein